MAEEEGRKISRFFYGGTKECEIDKQGRINLPPDYLGHADLEKELVFVGCGEYIEIWDKDTFEEEMSPANFNPSELMKKARNSSNKENDGV